MIKIFLSLLILLLPVYAEAAYKVYLKNGSIISGVSSYYETGNEYTIYFGTGTMGIPKKDVLKIEETKSQAEDFNVRESSEISESTEIKEKAEEIISPPLEQSMDKYSRVNELKNDLDSIISEIRASEEEETRLVETINKKSGMRNIYNVIQLKQLEKELEPLREQLSTVQQRKKELLQRKYSAEDELRSLQ